MKFQGILKTLLSIMRKAELISKFVSLVIIDRKEIPRMLMNAGELKLLEEYVEEKKERELFKWFPA